MTHSSLLSMEDVEGNVIKKKFFLPGFSAYFSKTLATNVIFAGSSHRPFHWPSPCKIWHCGCRHFLHSLLRILARPSKSLHNKIRGISWFMIKTFDFMWLNDVLDPTTESESESFSHIKSKYFNHEIWRLWMICLLFVITFTVTLSIRCTFLSQVFDFFYQCSPSKECPIY